MMQIKELDVWKSAMELTERMYDLAGTFTEKDNHGLAQQLRLTSIDIPSQIASAASKKYGKDSLKYLYDAKSKIYKLETQLHLAHRLNYINEDQLNEINESLDTARRLLFGFIKHYKKSSR